MFSNRIWLKILLFYCYIEMTKSQNAAFNEIIDTIQKDIKKFNYTQDWDLSLLKDIIQLDEKLIRIVFHRVFSRLSHEPLKLPDIKFQSSKLTVQISNATILNLNKVHLIENNVSRNGFGDYNGQFGYIWDQLELSANYKFSENLVSTRKEMHLEDKLTVDLYNYSYIYSWRLKLPAKLRRSIIKLHVDSVKVSVGKRGGNSLIANIINNAAANDLKAAINSGSLIITRPLGYGIEMVVNQFSAIIALLIKSMVNFIPGGPTLNTALYTSSRLGGIYKVLNSIRHRLPTYHMLKLN